LFVAERVALVLDRSSFVGDLREIICSQLELSVDVEEHVIFILELLAVKGDAADSRKYLQCLMQILFYHNFIINYIEISK
jgi:hypothetical protein